MTTDPEDQPASLGLAEIDHFAQSFVARGSHRVMRLWRPPFFSGIQCATFDIESFTTALAGTVGEINRISARVLRRPVAARGRRNVVRGIAELLLIPNGTMISRLTCARKAVRQALASSLALRCPVGTVQLARGMEMPAKGSSTDTMRMRIPRQGPPYAFNLPGSRKENTLR